MEQAPKTTILDEVGGRAEERRVAAVKALDLFGDQTSSIYDEAVFLASLICETPISLVTVLNGTHQRFKASVGIDDTEVSQEQSFCVHAIQQRELFVVPDTLLDNRFRENPFVVKAPNLRFYAGMPLATAGGYAVGTLCVVDVVPRELNSNQKKALTILSQQVAARFDDQKKVIDLSKLIAEKERIEKDLRNSNALFESFMDNSPLVNFMKDEAGRIIYYNRSFAESFGISRNAWIGKSDREFFPEDVAARLSAIDQEILKSDDLSVMEVPIPGPDGVERQWRTYKFAFVNEFGDRFLAGICHEITHEKQAQREIERYHRELQMANERLLALSITDPLTRCHNRRSFDERLNHDFTLAARHGFNLSVLLLDIDDFKAVNDSFGHETGDKVLCYVAELLKEGARETDLVCRYGGEEFAILLPHTDRESAFQLADRMRQSIERVWDGQRVTVSIGIGTASDRILDAAALVRVADEALYRAKAAGKNCVIPAAH